MKNFYPIFLIVALAFGTSCSNSNDAKSKVWSEKKAAAWYKNQGWLRGCNFIPSTAVNQLEMWQAETFDPGTIKKELTWAREIGFNCMRVYLHHKAWQQDITGFKSRMNSYLEIANNLDIKTIFVFFDDCWNDSYKTGHQPKPQPGIHNSRWLRDPGDAFHRDSALVNTLEFYVKDILFTFKDDNRIILWDLYNEPGNSGYGSKSSILLRKVFHWGREVNPTQPLTVGLWTTKYPELSKLQVENSDIITYHNYGNPDNHKEALDTLLLLNRPLICTQYMARNNNSMFQNIMPLLKEYNVGAINWGLVAGKTNTIYSWWEQIPDGSEPDLWFHDIFRPNGTPYRQEEVDCIRNLVHSSL